MTFEPSDLHRLYHAAIEDRDYPGLTAMFTEDAVYTSNGVGALTGREAILSAFHSYFQTYPDQIASDDWVETLSPRSSRTQWQLQAHHVTTGEAYIRRGLETVVFDDSGRIVSVDVTDLP